MYWCCCSWAWYSWCGMFLLYTKWHNYYYSWCGFNFCFFPFSLFVGLDCAVWSSRWTQGDYFPILPPLHIFKIISVFHSMLLWCWVLCCHLAWGYCFQEYIHRVGRTARGEGAKGNALLFLIPEELQFLRYLKVWFIHWIRKGKVIQ